MSSSKLSVSARCPGGERGAVAQVDDPLAGLDPTTQFGRIDRLGQREVDRRRAAPVERTHVGVVGGVRVQAGQQRVHVLLLAESQRRIDPLLLAHRGVVTAGRGRRAEAAESVRGEHAGLGRQFAGESADRVVLRVGELVGVVGTHQVGSAGRAVEHRSAGEYRGGAAGGIAQDVADVMVGVAGRVQHQQPHLTCFEHVAVADGVVVEIGVTAFRKHVRRLRRPAELQAPGDVVVVDVGLQDVGHPYAALLDQAQDPVDVSLRVHDHGNRAVGGQVAPVAETGSLDGLDGDHGCTPVLTLGGGSMGPDGWVRMRGPDSGAWSDDAAGSAVARGEREARLAPLLEAAVEVLRGEALGAQQLGHLAAPVAAAAHGDDQPIAVELAQPVGRRCPWADVALPRSARPPTPGLPGRR